ncbi:MAG: hypothetical protein AUH43_22915 [Acidobacteria bacterium 13_1_40CM_65_14]|nr:MAG: hypothetical protein AUH43_22915 [Acidobacteria bacterium 13_1_40CM_65_14]
MSKGDFVFSWLPVCVVAVATAAFACSKQRPPNVNAPLRIEPMTLGAVEPSLAPQLTVTADRALVSWIETQGRTSRLKFAERTPSGWSEPRTAASGDDLFTSWADVPSVFRLDAGTLVAQWLQTTDAAIDAYDVRLAFSKDQGRTWSAPTSPHHDGTKTQHGFASLFPAPGRGFGIVWLDGRAIETNAEKGNDNMSVRAATFDRDGKELGEALVDERACDCCPTAVAMTAAGPIAAFRDRSPDEVRDISVARRVNGQWTRPTTVHADVRAARSRRFRAMRARRSPRRFGSTMPGRSAVSGSRSWTMSQRSRRGSSSPISARSSASAGLIGPARAARRRPSPASAPSGPAAIRASPVEAMSCSWPGPKPATAARKCKPQLPTGNTVYTA